MMKSNSIVLSVCMSVILICAAVSPLKGAGKDTVAIHSLGHASVMFEFDGMIIHVDPISREADYSQLPDADLIFITHGHSDHYDLTALGEIKKDSTIMICNQEVKDLNNYTDTAIVLNNGDSIEIKGIPVKAVPAYNPEKAYHPKGVGNGYIFTFGEKKLYIAGDTENIPEMDNLGRIDIAFLPMNLPYTMTPEQAADAAIRIKPDILYIYHFSNSDTAHMRSLLSDHENIEVRIGESVYYEKTIRDPDDPSGLKKNEFDRVVVFPNPVKDCLTIRKQQSDLQLSVFNTTGQLFMKRQLDGNSRQLLDLDFLEPGIYVLQIENNHYNTNEILIKE
jgi:L-ascorbate metabolism protein UlaG (beta-lactamase superfamily)